MFKGPGGDYLGRARVARRRVLRHLVPSRRRHHRLRQRAEKHVREVTGDVVSSGPFAGMRLSPSTSWSSVAPKLAGTYEMEIAPWVEASIADEPSQVIVVGAAEGFYAVGLARRLPHALVTAYDIDPKARELCALNAKLNGVDARVEVRSTCTLELLRTSVTRGTALIFDCEGCELELLDPELVPELREGTIIVELHDFIHPGARDTILRRFESTHAIDLVDATARDHADYRILDRLDPRAARVAVDERRPVTPHPMQWAFLRPRLD